MSMAGMITQSIVDTIIRIRDIQGTEVMKGTATKITRINTAPIPAMKNMMNITTMSTAATRVMKATITAMGAEMKKIRMPALFPASCRMRPQARWHGRRGLKMITV